MEHGKDIVAEIDVTPQQEKKKRKTIFLFSYFLVFPFFMIFLILFTLGIKYQGNGYITRQAHKPSFQAVPSTINTSSIGLESSDGREQALNEFFDYYNSPLKGHAKTIIKEADAHNIDYRLLPAIAMQESTLCKKIIKDSHNCWGFGIYGGKVTKFKDYDTAIKTITATLAKKYVQKGYDSPEEIVTKYTPSDTGKWAQVVKMIMDRLHESL